MPDGFRGRVFSTMESMHWSVMMLSMTGCRDRVAILRSAHRSARSRARSARSTAIFWGWAHFTGRLPEPAREGVEPEEVEVHGEPRSLKARVVLVTGAAKRIGRGIALRLAEEGARVAIHYFESEDEARQTAEECGGAPLFRANLESVAGDRAHVRARSKQQLGQARRAGQQRRAVHALRSAGDHGEGLGLHPLRQFEGGVFLLPASGAR